MRILLSNDDGYFAPGLAALAEGLAALGDITVVAPERDRSGASNSLTLDRPLMLSRAHNGFLYVNGTPTDCVHMAVTGVLDFEPVEVVAHSGQKPRLALNVEDAETAKSCLRHRAQEPALARARAAAHGHHESLLAGAAAQRINFWFRRVAHLSLVSLSGRNPATNS